MKQMIIRIISVFFTLWGIYLLLRGDITNGLLSIIAGELIDENRFQNLNK